MSQNKDESPSATLRPFIKGLSYQIPHSKLSTMSNGEGIQRLFLERSTEALPMGSKIRNAVGSNFDEALHLLQMEIEKRMEEIGSSVESSIGAKSNYKKTSKGDISTLKYSLLAFSRDSFHSISSCNKKLKLCSDFASSSDFLLGTTDVLQSYKHALLYKNRDTTLSIDHGAFIYGFIEQLPDDDELDDVTNIERALKSIREFVSCLVMDEIPPGAASKVGELIGRFATFYFRVRSISSVSDCDQVNNIICMTISLLSSTTETVACFLHGYLRYTLNRIDEQEDKSQKAIFVKTSSALSRALLQCHSPAIQTLPKPTLQHILSPRKNNNINLQVKGLLNWATVYVQSHSTEENESGAKEENNSQHESNDSQSESENNYEEDFGDEEDVSTDNAEEGVDEEAPNTTLRRSTRKRRTLT